MPAIGREGCASLRTGRRRASVWPKPDRRWRKVLNDFNIPAGPLPNALTIFGDRAGLQILYPADLARGLTSPGVTGALSA